MRVCSLLRLLSVSGLYFIISHLSFYGIFFLNRTFRPILYFLNSLSVVSIVFFMCREVNRINIPVNFVVDKIQYQVIYLFSAFRCEVLFNLRNL